MEQIPHSPSSSATSEQVHHQYPTSIPLPTPPASIVSNHEYQNGYQFPTAPMLPAPKYQTDNEGPVYYNINGHLIRAEAFNVPLIDPHLRLPNHRPGAFPIPFPPSQPQHQCLQYQRPQPKATLTDPQTDPNFLTLPPRVRAAKLRKHRQAIKKENGMAAEQEAWWTKQQANLDVYCESPLVKYYRREDEKRIAREKRRVDRVAGRRVVSTTAALAVDDRRPDAPGEREGGDSSSSLSDDDDDDSYSTNIESTDVTDRLIDGDVERGVSLGDATAAAAAAADC